MNEPQPTPAGRADAASPPPAIDSSSAFADAIRWAFAAAVARDARRVLCVDRDFVHWPLGDPALLDLLTAWLRKPQRQLVLLAAGYDEVPRRHPRFVNWRRGWAHAVAAWAPPGDLGAELPTLFVDDGPILVRLFDAVHWRGRAERDALAARLQRDEIDAVLQRSEPAFPVTELGL